MAQAGPASPRSPLESDSWIPTVRDSYELRLRARLAVHGALIRDGRAQSDWAGAREDLRLALAAKMRMEERAKAKHRDFPPQRRRTRSLGEDSAGVRPVATASTQPLVESRPASVLLSVPDSPITPLSVGSRASFASAISSLRSSPRGASFMSMPSARSSLASFATFRTAASDEVWMDANEGEEEWGDADADLEPGSPRSSHQHSRSAELSEDELDDAFERSTFRQSMTASLRTSHSRTDTSTSSRSHPWSCGSHDTAFTPPSPPLSPTVEEDEATLEDDPRASMSVLSESSTGCVVSASSIARAKATPAKMMRYLPPRGSSPLPVLEELSAPSRPLPSLREPLSVGDNDQLLHSLGRDWGVSSPTLPRRVQEVWEAPGPVPYPRGPGIRRRSLSWSPATRLPLKVETKELPPLPPCSPLSGEDDVHPHALTGLVRGRDGTSLRSSVTGSDKMEILDGGTVQSPTSDWEAREPPPWLLARPLRRSPFEAVAEESPSLVRPQLADHAKSASADLLARLPSASSAPSLHRRSSTRTSASGKRVSRAVRQLFETAEDGSPLRSAPPLKSSRHEGIRIRKISRAPWEEVDPRAEPESASAYAAWVRAGCPPQSADVSTPPTHSPASSFSESLESMTSDPSNQRPKLRPLMTPVLSRTRSPSPSPSALRVPRSTSPASLQSASDESVEPAQAFFFDGLHAHRGGRVPAHLRLDSRSLLPPRSPSPGYLTAPVWAPGDVLPDSEDTPTPSPRPPRSASPLRPLILGRPSPRSARATSPPSATAPSPAPDSGSGRPGLIQTLARMSPVPAKQKHPGWGTALGAANAKAAWTQKRQDSMRRAASHGDLRAINTSDTLLRAGIPQDTVRTADGSEFRFVA